MPRFRSADTSAARAAAAGAVIRAALSLEDWLSKAVGDSAEWPVRITADNTADADGLAALLTDLSKACVDYRGREVSP